LPARDIITNDDVDLRAAQHISLLCD